MNPNDTLTRISALVDAMRTGDYDLSFDGSAVRFNHLKNKLTTAVTFRCPKCQQRVEAHNGRLMNHERADVNGWQCSGSGTAVLEDNDISWQDVLFHPYIGKAFHQKESVLLFAYMTEHEEQGKALVTIYGFGGMDGARAALFRMLTEAETEERVVEAFRERWAEAKWRRE